MSSDTQNMDVHDVYMMCNIYKIQFFRQMSIYWRKTYESLLSFKFLDMDFRELSTFIIFFLFFLFVVNFVIHWNETAMRLHVFPILIPPPTSPSTRSL